MRENARPGGQRIAWRREVLVQVVREVLVVVVVRKDRAGRTEKGSSCPVGARALDTWSPPSEHHDTWSYSIPELYDTWSPPLNIMIPGTIRYLEPPL